MRPFGACGRADLARAIATGDAALIALIAELLGFRSPTVVTAAVAATARVDVILGPVQSAPVSPPFVEPAAIAPATFWYVTGFAPAAAAETAEQPLAATDERPLAATAARWTSPAERPRHRPLAPWRELHPRLRQRVARLAQTGEPDPEAVVAALGHGRQLERIPRRRRLRWGPIVQVVADRSERLVPFWADQTLVAAHLARVLPAHLIEWTRIREGLDRPRPVRDCPDDVYRPPPPESLVMVLGDLGCLAPGDGPLCRQWLDFGRELRVAGCRPAALLPLPLSRCPAAVARVWDLLGWERTSGAGTRRRERAEHLLALVSPALRIEPGLLRAARLLLPAEIGDVPRIYTQNSERRERAPS